MLLEAHPKFFIIGTMNPSGDHGKRELSPALRNRFTEIWVTSILDKSSFELQPESAKEFFKNFMSKNFETKYQKEDYLEFIY